ncbi:hypothetical protein KKZ03_18190 [Methylobacter sp. S3L5C]|nr:hypothetical protein [Methylobacter sp. S3L5C]UOA08127.1 hypothetical protein KKZ03_18190 [Methylobacter sp. S3L5C]
MSVPERFRLILNTSEFTQSLRTQNRKDAIPAAYKLAGEAKKLFLCLDNLMIKNKSIDDVLLSEALDSLENEEPSRLLKLNAKRKAVDTMCREVRTAIKIDDLQNDNLALMIRHREELDALSYKIKADAFDKLTSSSIVSTKQVPINEKVIDSNAPLLSVVYGEFFAGHLKSRAKLESFKNVFIPYAGDVPITLINQDTVNNFFKLLVKCPGGRGGHSDAFGKLSLQERIVECEKSGAVLMGATTFKQTYLGAARQFFRFLKSNYASYNLNLSVEHINYKDFGGLRAKGENKQRALWGHEIERLMCCVTMRGYAVEEPHKFWLPMLGLFTGGRVNEICQLNPQTDILKDSVSGLWYLNLTEDDSGEGLIKSSKNKHSLRKVPIHSKLIECGLLDYVNRVKALGHDRIFNDFKPKLGRASYDAIVFFRNHLKNVGLYDDKTIGKNVLGMHCLRGSFMSHLVLGLKNSGIGGMDAMGRIQPIVGHCSGVTDENGKDFSVTLNYIDVDIIGDGGNNLMELKGIIEALDYGLAFPSNTS